jgi:type IV pilus assembly protein PilA
MRADRHGCLDPDERGFTLLELVVVMMIISVLVAIAVPILLTEQKKAHDVAAKSDASSLGKEITAYYVDATTAPTVTMVGGRYQVAGADVSRISDGVSLGTIAVTPAVAATADTTGWTSSAWCLNVMNAAGQQVYYKYSAQLGLQLGSCATASTP